MEVFPLLHFSSLCFQYRSESQGVSDDGTFSQASEVPPPSKALFVVLCLFFIGGYSDDVIPAYFLCT